MENCDKRQKPLFDDVKKILVCPICYPHTDLTGLQYRYDHPAHYDGISEYFCQKCDARWGRWTKERLFHGEFEWPYGVDPR